MATITSGNSAAFTLSGDQYITITTLPNSEGSLIVTPIGQDSSSGSTVNTLSTAAFGPPQVAGKQYGPYGEPVSVTLKCAKGSVDYAVSAGSARWTPDGSGLVDTTGKIAQYVGVAERHRLKNDQPYGITKGMTGTGNLVCRFISSEITINNGAPAVSDTTGYDANGVETGIVSITGQTNLVKIVPAADSIEGVRFTTFATSVRTSALKGKFGIWLYVDALPGFQAGGTVGASEFHMVLTTEAGGATTNALQVGWNANQLREGWNFLTFVMRDPTAYTTGSGVTEYHPYGLSAQKFGTGADTNIVAYPITKILFQWSGMSGATIYLDSMWTGVTTKAQIVLGIDSLEADVVSTVLPIFNSYGWRGYVAVPARVWNGVENRILADFAGTSGNVALVARGAAVKAAGWDFVNHTTNHLPGTAGSPKMGGLTDAAEIAYEILQTKHIYAANGLTKGNEFYASPQSSTSRLAEKVVKGCGIKLQRHLFRANVPVTPWGVDNAHHVGASGVGSNTATAYTKTTSGATSSVNGMQVFSKLKIVTDVMAAYGATWFPFWHYTTTLGDSGSGEDLTGDDLFITVSALTLWLAYIKQLEAAGSQHVCDGITGFYYGVGR